MLTRILLVIFAAAPLLALGSPPPPAIEATQKIQVTTADGLTQTAWFTAFSEKGKAPLWVLLPMMNHDHTSFQPLIEALTAYVQSDTTGNTRLPHILSLDLRGHGESVNVKGTPVPADKMQPADFAKIPLDVRQMVEHVVADTGCHVDAGNIVVIGASIGANSAVMAGAMLPGVRRVVMLSPGEEYRSLAPGEAVKKFGKPMLIYACAGDSYSAESSRALGQLDRVNSTVRILSGTHHGTDIINGNAKTMQEMLSWLYK
jgi:hypothetical protein